jgi:protein-S-isoprenylcysteine O-methyltransferase Ste14
MFVINRRRERKRSAQHVYNKRQGALNVTWAAIVVGFLAVLGEAFMGHSGLHLAILILSTCIAVGALVAAHVFWRKELVILGHAVPVVSVRVKSPTTHHRVQDTHRHTPRNAGIKASGATRLAT